MNMLRCTPYIKFCLILLFVVVGSKNTHAQITDSVAYYVKNNKPLLFGGFHNRNSTLGTVPIRIYGIRGGLEFGERVSFFVGFYTTYDVTDRFNIDSVSHPVKNDTFKRSTNLSYLSLGGEYVFKQRGRWTFALQMMGGLGTGHRKIFKNNIFESDEKIWVLPLESGIRTHFSITDWLGLEATLGLRISPFNSYEFTGFYHSFGINVYPGVIYRRVFKKEKKKETASNNFKPPRIFSTYPFW